MRRLRVRLDACIMVWLLGVVFATGAALMLVFDGDAEAHRRAIGPWWVAIRHLHAGASLALVVATLLHVAQRIGDGSPKGMRTGAYTLAAVSFAVLTGALAAQTADADRIAQQMGFDAAPVVPAAVVHIAYATVVVLLTLYLHVARWGWGHVLGQPRQSIVAALASVTVAWLLPVALPGGDGGGSTRFLAPPTWWPWLLVLAAGLWISAFRRRGGARPSRP